jgi:multisubunit Na+/H+ antiporter MnhC subunit
MEQVDQGKFSCEGCGKSYRWKPELAGRKVKCKCGFIMTAPKEPPVSDEPDLDALYSLADEGKEAARSAVAEAPTIRCPSCKTALEPGSSLCAQCGFNLKTGSRAKARATPAAGTAYVPSGGGAAVATAPNVAGGAFSAFGAPRRRGEDLKMERNDAIIDWYVPIGLLVLGIALGTLRFMKFSTDSAPLPQALMFTGIKMVLGFALVAFAAIFMIKWGEIAFGDPLQAAVKIAAAVTAPVAVAEIISFLIHDAPPTGWGLVGFFLAFGMFFILYHYLFEWDLSEKWVVVGVTTIICMLAVPFLFTMIQGSSGGALISKGAKNNNALYDYQLELGRAKPARAWIEEASGRLVGDLSRETSVQLIDDLYALGPKNGEVYVFVEGPQAAEIIVRLPSDSKKRKAFFDYRSEFGKKNSGGQAEPDDGGKWMVMRFLFVSHPEPL